ncbi:MAG: ATP-dependent 6-phosphofructokinase [Deltaproteobacteria bacterium]|nr:ATP-dependent 6-phosphofructokinase [Deltaproteobacteria bacterium]
MAKTIGLLTGGGDCPGLNAVIWSVVRAAAHEGIEVLGIEDGFEGLIAGGTVRKLGPAETRGIHREGGTVLGTTNRGNPFRYRTEQPDGSVVETDCSDDVVRAVRRLGLEGLITIGGDGSLAIAHELSKKGVPIIGVPKTIDNDLSATDNTFGFYSAVTTAMEALDKLKTTAESHDRVMILEVMGRDAGWIAIASGLAAGAHCILIPEIPYRTDVVLERIRSRWAEEQRNYTLIVVAEGAFSAGGDKSYVQAAGVGTVARFGGAGHQLQAALEAAFSEGWDRRRGVPEVRTTVLGHLQRGGSPGAYDRIISMRFGAHAAQLAAAGKWNRMVALQGIEIGSVPLAEAIGKQHLVEADGQLVQTARAVGICMGDRWP